METSPLCCLLICHVSCWKSSLTILSYLVQENSPFEALLWDCFKSHIIALLLIGSSVELHGCLLLSSALKEGHFIRAVLCGPL